MNITELVSVGLMLFTPVITDIPEDKSASVECLALNMYHEARGQGSAGLLGVSSVVFNRVKDKRFPNTICGVIYQAKLKQNWKGNMVPVLHKCQFSWYCDGKSDKPRNKKTYKKMLDFADAILSNKLLYLDITDGATHYHADYVNPKWSKTLTLITKIDDHIFYRWE